MRRPKLLHPVTADMCRELSVAALAKAGAFKRPMKFPFQHLETAPDHIRVFRVGDKSRQTPQIVAPVHPRNRYTPLSARCRPSRRRQHQYPRRTTAAGSGESLSGRRLDHPINAARTAASRSASVKLPRSCSRATTRSRKTSNTSMCVGLVRIVSSTDIGRLD